jgi:hypothetical protein
LAFFTVISAPAPARQLNAFYFESGRPLGFLWRELSYFKANVLASLSLGNNGIFGFHQLYYSSLRLAPVPETGLFIALF